MGIAPYCRNLIIQEQKMKIANSITELIGNTPLVKLNRLTEGLKAEVAVKLEFFNPGSSVKDRIAEAMIEGLRKSGQNQQKHRHCRSNQRQYGCRFGNGMCRTRLQAGDYHAGKHE